MANISYDIFSPMRKLSNVLLSVLSDNDYKVQCQSLDQRIVNKKTDKKLDAYTKSKYINPLLSKIGRPTHSLPFEVTDPTMLEMADRLGFFKTKYEVALEKLAESGFRASNWAAKEWILIVMRLTFTSVRLRLTTIH
jgi:hypothetical protein